MFYPVSIGVLPTVAAVVRIGRKVWLLNLSNKNSALAVVRSPQFHHVPFNYDLASA